MAVEVWGSRYDSYEGREIKRRLCVVEELLQRDLDRVGMSRRIAELEKDVVVLSQSLNQWQTWCNQLYVDLSRIIKETVDNPDKPGFLLWMFRALKAHGTKCPKSQTS